jgi:CDP-glucose 4,6-dehydratase
MGFWAGKRVLVTGHTGFKGSWLSFWLRESGAIVTGVALPPPSQPNLFEVAGIANGIVSVEADVREAGRVREIFRSAEPEVVFHLAAQSLVRPSYEDPIGTFGTNVMGTVSVLDAVRHAPSVRSVVIVTSDKCYQNNEWIWGYRENEPMGGHDPYSSSKGCAELVTASFRHSYFASGKPAVASARAGNVIGGGDWARDRLVPDLVQAFAEGRPAQVRNPLAVRPWQHVLDPLHGYLRLAERLCEDPARHAEGWNFGPADAGIETVSVVASAAARMWGNGARWETPVGAHPHEARSLRLDSSKARAQLGWRPRYELVEAVQTTVDWYRRFFNGENARELTLSQLRAYESRT